MTLIELITQSLSAIGVARVNQTLSAMQVQGAVSALNIMVDEWNAEGLLINAVTRETFTMTAGKESYTWGSTTPASDFTSARPIDVKTVFITEGGIDYPVDIIGREEYEAIPLKTDSARPQKVWINPTYPAMTLYFDFVPDAAYTLNIDSEKDLIDFSNLTAEISLPPEYKAALKWNLAAEMAPAYNLPPMPKVEKRAQDSKDTLRRINLANNMEKTTLRIFTVQQASRGNILDGWDT